MLLCASMFAGCGSDEAQQETEQQTTEEQTADSNSASASGLSSEDCSGQVLTWNLGVDSQTLDPAFSVSDDSDSVINNTSEGLMRNSGEGAQPAMAQDMPQETVRVTAPSP